MEPDAQLRARFESMSDGQLLRIVEVDGQNYSDAALDLAIAILAGRGLQAVPAPPPSPEERSETAKDLRLAGFNRVLWGGALAVIGGVLSLAADGRIIFYGLVLGGSGMLFSGLAMRGGAEKIEREIEEERKAEIERVAGSLSPVVDSEAGALSTVDTDASPNHPGRTP